MLQALEDAGLGGIAPQMLAGNGLVKGTPEQLAKKEKICEGAVPREHSHFFTEWGTFGSLDWNGDQVDDGLYEIVDDRTFTIGDATFHFEVQGRRAHARAGAGRRRSVRSRMDGGRGLPGQDVGARELRTAAREWCRRGDLNPHPL